MYHNNYSLKDWTCPYNTIIVSTIVLVTFNLIFFVPAADTRILPVPIQIPHRQNRCARVMPTITRSLSSTRRFDPIFIMSKDFPRILKINGQKKKPKKMVKKLRPHLRKKEQQLTAKCFNFWTTPPAHPPPPSHSWSSYLPNFLSDWIFVGSTIGVRPPHLPPRPGPSPTLQVGVNFDPVYIVQDYDDDDHYFDYYPVHDYYETYDYDEYGPPPPTNYPTYDDDYYLESDYDFIEDYHTNTVTDYFSTDYDSYDFDSNGISSYDFSGHEDFSSSDFDSSVSDFYSSSDSYSESSSDYYDYD